MEKRKAFRHYLLYASTKSLSLHAHTKARREEGETHAVEREPLFLSLLKNRTSPAKEFGQLSTHVHVLGWSVQTSRLLADTTLGASDTWLTLFTKEAGRKRKGTVLPLGAAQQPQKTTSGKLFHAGSCRLRTRVPLQPSQLVPSAPDHFPGT